MPAADSIERINALLALYRESHYDVALPDGGTATIRVSAPLPEPVLRWIGRDCVAVYMTACNPHSQSLPAAENEQRLERLRARLRERGCAFLEGAGHVPGESWREPSLLIRGIDDAVIDGLVREYEQNAVLVMRPPAAAVMRIYRPDWEAAIGAVVDIEWARPLSSSGATDA
jgi:uncharacterized protein DUF3293